MRGLELILYDDVALTVTTGLRPSVDRKRDDALILGVETPAEDTDRVVDREGSASVLERDDAFGALCVGKLGHVRVLLEREVVADILNFGTRGWRSEGQLDFCERRVGDPKVQIALELERLESTIAQEGERELLADGYVNAEKVSEQAGRILTCRARPCQGRLLIQALAPLERRVPGPRTRPRRTRLPLHRERRSSRIACPSFRASCLFP